MKASRTKIMFLSIALLLTMWGVHPAAFAQSDRGSITGKVTDNTGALLPGAIITLKNEATGVTQTATSNQSGDYVFQLLNPGSYSLSVTAQGFKNEQRTHIVVDVNQANEQNVAMNIGATSETIEVTAGGVQQLQTETGSMGLIVEQKSIQELPLIYGNPFTLANLAPGIAVSGVNPNIHSYDSSTASISINGSALNSIEYRLDGAPDNRIRLSAYTPSSEFINQYKVDTATYDATQGHSAGGFVNTSLKSGSNAFHGGVFGSYQYPGINASPWKSSGPTRNNWLREGGDIGGPLWKNRAFFFTGLEHSRETTPNVQLLTIPSLAERTGDLSEVYALGCSGYTFNSQGVAICPNGSTNAYQLYDPTSGKSVTGGVCGSGKTCTVRTPIPYNKITNINPIAAKALKYYPTPNATPNAQGGGNYSYSAAEPNYYYAYIVRVDTTLTPNQNLYGHWVQSRRLQPGKNGYFAPVSGTNLTYQNKGAALGYTWTINPATVLDAHLSWTRFVNQNSLPSQGVVNATAIGMPSYLVDGMPDAANAFPRLDITGYQSLNSDSGVLSHNDISLGSVQLSHLFGNHFVRGGFEYRVYHTNAGSTSQSNGRYQHSGTYTTSNSNTSAGSNLGFGLAQFLYGLPNSSAITIASNFASRSDYMAEWIQDDWKATPKLTVNLGLRVEYESPNTERNQRANTYFDFNAVNPASAAAKAAYASIASTNPTLLPASSFNVNGGLRFLGDASTPFGGHQTYQSPVTLLPRAGFSWEFLPQTVVRGGFGMFADSLSTFYMSGGNSGSTTTFLIPQQGFSQTTNVSGSPDTGVTFTSTLANPFPTGIAQPSGSSLGLSTYLGQSVTFQPSNPQVPYNERWSFGLQRQFGAWLAALDYVGNHGVHLPTNREYDPVPQSYLSPVSTGYDADTYTRLNASVSNPFYKVLPSTVSLGSSKTTSVAQLLRPYPEFTGVTAFITNGSSTYHSLQAQLNRRFNNGASLTSSFTWQKSLDATQYLNISDANPWYGVSANDRPLRFATSGIYQIPFGAGRRWANDTPILSQIIGGWQVQGVYQVQSGAPLSFNPSTGSIPLYYGSGSPASTAWGKAGYDQNSNNLSTTGNWFDTSRFGTVAASTSSTGIQVQNSSGKYYYGNQYQLRTMPIRFNGLRADNLNQFDGAIQRNFSLSRLYEAASLQFRFDLINALNHPVYAAPSTDWTSSTFGQITAQGNSPRLYQFEAFIRF